MKQINWLLTSVNFLLGQINKEDEWKLSERLVSEMEKGTDIRSCSARVSKDSVDAVRTSSTGHTCASQPNTNC